MVMKLIVEAVAYSFLYAVFVLIIFKKQGAIRQLHDYPPKIQKRAVELGITTDEEMAQNAKKSKPLGFVIMTIMNLIIICLINGEKTFWAGFYQSYIFFNAFSLLDAAVIDSVYFCHSKFWRIPGTEDMAEEYHDYWFHWKWFFIGLITLVPMAAIIGGLTVLIGGIL
jgi:hypothetical protein